MFNKIVRTVRVLIASVLKKQFSYCPLRIQEVCHVIVIVINSKADFFGRKLDRFPLIYYPKMTISMWKTHGFQSLSENDLQLVGFPHLCSFTGEYPSFLGHSLAGKRAGDRSTSLAAL